MMAAGAFVGAVEGGGGCWEFVSCEGALEEQGWPGGKRGEIRKGEI